MKLLTNELIKRFAEVGDQSEKKAEDTIIVCKFFNPVGAGTWYATEYDPETKTFFGYVSIFGDECDELGYFSLEELETLQLPMGMKIERDLYTKEQKLSEVIKN